MWVMGSWRGRAGKIEGKSVCVGGVGVEWVEGVGEEVVGCGQGHGFDCSGGQHRGECGEDAQAARASIPE